MSAVVIDASVVLRWAFDDERDREGALRIADALADGRLVASGAPHLLLEVAAALVVGIRTRRIDRATADAVLAALTRVQIHEVDPHGFATATYSLAIEQGVRVPDAAYLETARRLGASLISADGAQLRAARAIGLSAMPIDEVPATDT